MKSWKHLTFEQRKVISNGISHKYAVKTVPTVITPSPAR